MGSSVFLSHAGIDSPTVTPVAGALREAGLNVRLDRDELRHGDSFVSFMESALKASDYCLLLWSRAASESKWVRAEWEAAFHRAVTEAQNFLIVGRLEEFPVPELLRPRLRVELYPEINSGIRELVSLWQDDRRAESETSRPVAPPKAEVNDDRGDATVYITSELFGKTFPMRVAMGVPVAMIVERIQSRLGLPLQLDIEGRVGCRFNYTLVHAETTLNKDSTLSAQSVNPGATLWLQTRMEPFGAGAPVAGAIRKVTFRGRATLTNPTEAAQRHLMALLNRVGLGSGVARARQSSSRT